MEQIAPITDWLYYNQQTSIADIRDKRIVIGIANVMSLDEYDQVDVFDTEGEGTENFTDYVMDDESKLLLYRKVLLYFTREAAEPLSDVEKERLDGLRSIIGEEVAA